MAVTNSIASYLLTLTSANTNYNIAALVAAINSSERTSFSEVRITSYGGIDGGGTPNTNDILVGDANLSTTRMSDILTSSGDSYTERSGMGGNDISTLNLYVRSAGAAQKLMFRGRVS